MGFVHFGGNATEPIHNYHPLCITFATFSYKYYVKDYNDRELQRRLHVLRKLPGDSIVLGTNQTYLSICMKEEGQVGSDLNVRMIRNYYCIKSWTKAMFGCVMIIASKVLRTC